MVPMEMGMEAAKLGVSVANKVAGTVADINKMKAEGEAERAGIKTDAEVNSTNYVLDSLRNASSRSLG